MITPGPKTIRDARRARRARRLVRFAQWVAGALIVGWAVLGLLRT